MVSFDDPKQGTLDNCTFIASLSSAMWSNALLQTTFAPQTCNANAYLVKFSSKATGDVDIYVDSAPLPGGATSNDPNQIWPALYEKGYALFCKMLYSGASNTSSCKKPLNSVAPPYPWAVTIEALEHVTKKTRATANPIYTSSISNGTTLLQNIAGLTNPNASTATPMLGWVKSTTMSPPPATSCFNTDPMLVGSSNGHTYSILGLYPNKLNPTDIVLRDPTGADIIGTRSGTWNLGRTKQITLNTNGIFTIDPVKFLSCFNYYHYVI
jgi:hypothetical protein